MDSLKEKLYQRLLIQLSDIPWMVTAGVYGFLIEWSAVFLNLWSFSIGWLIWVKIIGLYGGAVGYSAFLFNRTKTAFIAGAVIGLLYESVNTYVYSFQQWGALGPVSRIILSTIFFSILPYLVDKLVDPHLFRGGFRWLASQHPRYSHLSK